MSLPKLSLYSTLLLFISGVLHADELEHPLVDASGVLPVDLTPWGMFLNADWIVKGVLISLVIASIITWTIWLIKLAEVRLMHRRMKQAVAESSKKEISLEQLLNCGLATQQDQFLQQVNEELELSGEAAPTAGVKERIESRLTELENSHNQQLTQGTGVLASIGSTAPFVGLFGTVWGIMNSFIGISQANTTNLAVVAPGIAEALLATAMGLVAAIPAVVLYNFIVRRIANYRTTQRQFCLQIVRLISRQLDGRIDLPVTRKKHEAA